MTTNPKPRASVWEHPAALPELCRYLTDRSSQPMVAVEGPTHVVCYVNPAFCQLAGIEARELLGRPFVEAVPEPSANQCASMLARVFATGSPEALSEQEHNPAVLRRGAVTSTHWSYLAWPILGQVGESGENPVGVMVQVIDASDIAAFRKESASINASLLVSGLRQHELATEAEHLSAVLRERDAHERAARIEAQAANHSKDMFLAALSHELRTPLHAILGWASMLRERREPLDADVTEALSVIERNARAQADLIDDILDVARINSGKFVLHRRSVDLCSLVSAAVDAVRPSAVAKQLSLALSSPDESLWLDGDESRLQQAVANLLTNAIKFTLPGGSVKVSVERVDDADGSIARVTVADDGQGIHPHFLPRVFERFRQADEGTTRGHGGLGLGLSLVQHILEAHGGSALAYSAGEGRGATFVLELSAASDPVHLLDRRTAPPATALPRLDGLRVLVVDDELDARSITGRELVSAGATVILAASAEEGYRLAVDVDAGARPRCIVSDIGMPGEDGYSMIRRIRATPTGAGMIAIAITAFAAREDKLRALRAGFDLHLAKPVDARALVVEVARLTARPAV